MLFCLKRSAEPDAIIRSKRLKIMKRAHILRTCVRFLSIEWAACREELIFRNLWWADLVVRFDWTAGFPSDEWEKRGYSTSSAPSKHCTWKPRTLSVLSSAPMECEMSNMYLLPYNERLSIGGRENGDPAFSPSYLEVLGENPFIILFLEGAHFHAENLLHFGRQRFFHVLLDSSQQVGFEDFV